MVRIVSSYPRINKLLLFKFKVCELIYACLGSLPQQSEEVGSVVRSRGCSACCARRVYWNVNYFGVIRAIAMARAVVGHREHAVPVACWPSTIYGCSYELSIGLYFPMRARSSGVKEVVYLLAFLHSLSAARLSLSG